MKILLFARRFGRRLAALCLLGSISPTANAQADAEAVSGQALHESTQAPLPYASIGVLGRPVGTVADEQGQFTLRLPRAYDADSLRISLVGYRPLTMTVRAFRQRTCPPAGLPCPVLLVAAPHTTLSEVVVRPKGRLVRRVLGNSSNSKYASMLFESNDLGNQVGQLIRIKYPTMLEQVSFYINKCTYDSLFYRVNVYRLGPTDRPDEQHNILPEAVYVRLAKAQTAERIRVDLSRYQLWLEPGQSVVVCLELVRNLGPGKLYLTATMLGGPFFVKEGGVTKEWEKVGALGMASTRP